MMQQDLPVRQLLPTPPDCVGQCYPSVHHGGYLPPTLQCDILVGSCRERRTESYRLLAQQWMVQF
jgi:hypothetical protein